MSIAAIVERIDAEAQTEADAILAEADLRAAGLVGAATAERDRRVAAALERAEPGLRADRTRRANAARMRRLDRDASLAATRTARAFELAGARLEAIAAGADPDRWLAALRTLTRAAIAEAGDRAVIRIRVADAAHIEDLVAAAGGRLELVDQAGMPPGVIVRSADGRLEIDATLPTRLERARLRLADATARSLGVGDRPADV
jgi:vacuolar-type H+-ATPase subunit E/Vma4